jgi:hypothetical protein
MNQDKMFELADELKSLRDKKADLEAEVKETTARIDEVDYRLSELMAETETQNFTRAGTMFCLTTKTRASAAAGVKDDLYAALRANGFGDLVYETVNANSLSSFRFRKRGYACGDSVQGYDAQRQIPIFLALQGQIRCAVVQFADKGRQH